MTRAHQRIGDLLPDVLKHVGKQHALLEDLRKHWPTLVGRRVAAHSRPVSVRKHQLIVAVSHPGESFALHYQKDELLRKLEAQTHGEVTSILVRPGEAPNAVPD